MATLEAVPAEKLKGQLDNARRQGARIVFTNGVFDLLHRGHIRYLREARAMGDLLVVALNSDASVARLKGPRRPLLPLSERVKIMAALDMVDYVTSFDEDTPLEIIELIQPDVLVKGGDYTPDTIVGRDAVEARGGRVVALPLTEGASTSGLITRILQSANAAAK